MPDHHLESRYSFIEKQYGTSMGQMRQDRGISRLPPPDATKNARSDAPGVWYSQR